MIIDSPIISGSYAASGSLNQLGNVVISGSLTVTGSIIGSSSYALTASYATNAGAGAGFPFSGSAQITGSLLITELSGSGVRYLTTDNDGLIVAQTASAAIKTTQAVTSTAGQTSFNITNGYTTGLVDVFINGTKLSAAEFTDTSGTVITLATGSNDGDTVEFVKYFPASGVTNNALRQLTQFTATAGQTVFSASYTPGLLDIYYNGARLSTSDYTANNGTYFTLATASAANDILDVLVYSYQVGAFSGIGGQGVTSQIAYFNTTSSITGSNNFTINDSTMTVTGSLLVSGSGTFTNIGPTVMSGSLNVSGAITTNSTITAQTLVVQTITSSISSITGSTNFGSLSSNTHNFTGSLIVSGTMFVSSSGNIGIGTTSPRSTFDVRFNADRGIRFSSPGVSTESVIAGYQGDVSSNIRSLRIAGDNIYFNTGDGTDSSGTQRMAITSAGVLQLGTVGSTGTGTSSPVTMGFGSTFGTNPVGTNFKLKLFEDTTPNIFGFGISNALLEIIAGNSSAIGFFANGSERMRISSAGALSLNTGGPGLVTLGASNSYGSISATGGATLYMNGGTRGGSTTAASSAAVLAADGDIYFTNNAVNSTKMIILSGGNVGIGTSSPGQKLSIVENAEVWASSFLNGNGTESIDVYLAYGNGGHGIAIDSTENDTKYLFKAMAGTGNGGGKGSVPVIYAQCNGQVYVGATSMPNDQRFGIVGSGVYSGGCIGLRNTGTSGITYTIFSTDSSFSQGASNLLFYNNNGNVNNLILYANGNYDFAGSDVSDRRLKQDIEDINFGLDEIMALSPKSYHLKSEDNTDGENRITLRKRYGFIAQEVQPILPDAITGQETETDYLGLDYNGVLAVAIKAIQEQQATITSLQTRIEQLENK